MRTSLSNVTKDLLLYPVSVSEEGVCILKVDKLEPAYKYRLSINWNDKEYKIWNIYPPRYSGH